MDASQGVAHHRMIGMLAVERGGHIHDCILVAKDRERKSVCPGDRDAVSRRNSRSLPLHWKN